MKSIVESALAQRQALLSQRQRNNVDLPLRFWRQQAHFTTPATGRPERALAGLEPVPGLLSRHQITLADVADHSGADQHLLNQLVTEFPQSPLVMIDAEDAVAGTQAATLQARAGAIDCFQRAEWGETLRFFRPAGLGLDSCVEDLSEVIAALVAPAADQHSSSLLLDGIIWPKIEHASEMRWLCELLTRLEHHLGLAENSIRLQFLVESASALQQLDKITEVARPRLCGIIWGAADYAADTGLQKWHNHHPLFDWARALIVNAAGAAGVPAIDAMTFNYPTPLYRGDDLSDHQRSANREKILTALTEVYADAVHGRDLGMSGKWVGHPAQLLMVQAAYRSQIDDQGIQRDLRDLESYQAALAEGVGATILGEGADAKMADRATDRDLRSRLRRAAALGVLPAQTARQAKLITEQEFSQLQGVHPDPLGSSKEKAADV